MESLPEHTQGLLALPSILRNCYRLIGQSLREAADNRSQTLCFRGTRDLIGCKCFVQRASRRASGFAVVTVAAAVVHNASRSASAGSESCAGES